VETLVWVVGEVNAWLGEGCIGWPAFSMRFDKGYGAITLLVSFFLTLRVQETCQHRMASIRFSLCQLRRVRCTPDSKKNVDWMKSSIAFWNGGTEERK